MKIQLKEWKVRNILFSLNENKSTDELQKEDSNNFDLEFGHFYPEGQSKEFGIGFKIYLPDEKYSLKMEMVFLFLAEDEIPSDFSNSHFLKINAPAIAFPYLRAFVSNLTLQMGFDPIMLPSVNFVALAEKKDQPSIEE